MNTSRILIKAAVCVSAALLIVSASQAREGEATRDYVTMKDGKMMVMKEGKTMPMQKEMTMSNGTKVTTDGTVMMKDGTKKMMKDGEAITMDGMMMNGKMKK